MECCVVLLLQLAEVWSEAGLNSPFTLPQPAPAHTRPALLLGDRTNAPRPEESIHPSADGEDSEDDEDSIRVNPPPRLSSLQAGVLDHLPELAPGLGVLLLWERQKRRELRSLEHKRELRRSGRTPSTVSATSASVFGDALDPVEEEGDDVVGEALDMKPPSSPSAMAAAAVSSPASPSTSGMTSALLQEIGFGIGMEETDPSSSSSPLLAAVDGNPPLAREGMNDGGRNILDEMMGQSSSAEGGLVDIDFDSHVSGHPSSPQPGALGSQPSQRRSLTQDIPSSQRPSLILPQPPAGDLLEEEPPLEYSPLEDEALRHRLDLLQEDIEKLSAAMRSLLNPRIRMVMSFSALFFLS